MPEWSDAETEVFTAWQRAEPEAELLHRQAVVSRPAGAVRVQNDNVMLSGEHFRQMLARESKGVADDETLALVEEKLALTRNGFDSGKLYYMIATEIFHTAGEDDSKKRLAGFFLLRAAERGHVEGAAQYGWLVYSGHLHAETHEQTVKWVGVAAVKKNPLAQ